MRIPFKCSDFTKKFGKPESHRSFASFQQSGSEADFTKMKGPAFENTYKMYPDK